MINARSCLFGAFLTSAHDEVAGKIIRACQALGVPHSREVRIGEQLAGVAESQLSLPSRQEVLFSGYLIDGEVDARLVAGIVDPASERLSTYDGPFCAAVVDGAAEQGYLVRDKFGLRPLYYARSDGEFWFADDIRLLLQVLEPPAVRKQGLLEWLHFGAALQPCTLFEGISTVPAGSTLKVDLATHGHAVMTYFRPEDTVSPSAYYEIAGRSLREIETGLEEKLDGAVARACAGQPAVTVLMSGGVDSSLIAAMASRHTKVYGLTIDIVGEGAESEGEFGAAAARHLGIQHRIVRFGPAEFREALPEAVAVLGTPIIIENAVALHHAARIGAIPAGQLMLDGEGADALFCGSVDLFKYSMALISLASMTGVPTRHWRSMAERLRRSAHRVGLRTSSTMDRSGLDAMLGARGLEIDLLTHRLLTVFEHIPDQAEREVVALMLREFYDYLVPLMLRIDAMAATARTHVVLPFLESDLFAFSQNIPLRHKIRWSWRIRRPITKWITKRLAARLLPPKLIYRPKGGFGIPGAQWLRSDQESPTMVAETFGLPVERVAAWAAKECASRDSMFLWTMEMWLRTFSRTDADATARS